MPSHLPGLRCITILAALGAITIAPRLEGQSLRDRLKATVKGKAEQATERAANQATDKAIATVEGVIRCLVTDMPCIRRAQAAGAPVLVVDGKGAPVSSADSTAAVTSARATATTTSAVTRPADQPATAPSRVVPGVGAWVRYDFVPGERPLFHEDFTRDEVGDFPRRLEFKEGNGEVVEWQGQRFLRATDFTRFFIPLPEVLPTRFTVEIEYAGQCCRNLLLRFYGDAPPDRAQEIFATSENAGIVGGGMTAAGAPERAFRDSVFTLRVMVDGDYAKVYMNEHRIANVPNARLGRSNRILVAVPGDAKQPGMIRSIRVAAGGRDLYEAIGAKGRVATQGILFDSGSDVLRPESTPTLKAIARMLREHVDLRLVIEGHTDDVGEAAVNLSLSERRAAAVVAHLTGAEGIASDRVSSRGLGETTPAASNSSAEGRQANRRVELVRVTK